jgi:hypothetical protein
MPGLLIQIGAQLQCPHGGTIIITPAGAQVTTNTQAIATIAATGSVAGCANLDASMGQVPCTVVTWTTGTVRVTLNGVPALVPTSLAVFNCVPPLPPVPATVLVTQTHATGS